MAEIYRYKVLAEFAVPGGGTHVIYSNTTANMQTVVTDVWIMTGDAGARGYLCVNGQRIRRVVPTYALYGWRYPGMFLVLAQGDELKLETIGPTPPAYFNVIVYGFERRNAPVPNGEETYSFKSVVGQIAWTSGPGPVFDPPTLIYSPPPDTVFLIHSWWVCVDNPTAWQFVLEVNGKDFAGAQISDTQVWDAGRQDAGKIILEAGDFLKMRALATGTPVQALLFYFGGVERKNQP